MGLSVYVGVGILIILTLGVIGMWTTNSDPLSEYELYGEEGADGFEQRMMGLTNEEYIEYRKTGHQIKSK